MTLHFFRQGTLLISLLFVVGFVHAQCGPDATGTPCTAPTICTTPDMDDYCGITGGANAPLDISASTGCVIEMNNTEWVSFVAGSSTLELEIEVEDCISVGVGNGLQAAIVQASNCSSPMGWTLMSNCWNGSGVEENIILTASGLVPGQLYYVMIDGYDGAICEYEFEVNAGQIGFGTLTPITNVVGPLTVCGGSTAIYTPSTVPGADSYLWSENTGTAGVALNGVLSGMEVTFPDLGADYTVNLCVEPANQCVSGTPYCFDVTVSNTTLGVNPPELILCPGESSSYNGVTYTYGAGTPALQTVPVTLSTANGCDSLVTLTVRRTPNTSSTRTVVLCQGEVITICGNDYSAAGLTAITCPNASYLGCDSTIFLTIQYNNVNAVCSTPALLTCANPCTTLNAAASTASGTKTYKWFDSAGVQLGTAASQQACSPGVYTLVVVSTVIIPPPTGGTKVCTDTLFITVSADPNSSLPAQPVISGPLTYCSNEPISFSTPIISGITNYTWVISGVGSIQSGQGTNTINVLATGDISLTLEVSNLCGNSLTGTYFSDLQTITANAGANQFVCGPNINTPLPATPFSVGQTGFWSAVPLSGTLGSGSITNASGPNSAEVNFSTSGTYYLIHTLTQGACQDADTALYTVSQALSTSNLGISCNANGSLLTVTFQINNGVAPYTVSTTAGGPSIGTLAGNVFTSNGMTPSGSYPFFIEDGNGCQLNITPTGDCGCLSNAGDMPDAPIIVCSGNDVQVSVIAGTPFFDLDDIGLYVLHTSASNTLGTILGQNTTGFFTFDDAIMTYGNTYYVSYVVGTDNGSGQILLGPADCFSVTLGQPVTFYPPLPTPFAGNNLAVCGNIINLEATPVTNPVIGNWTSVGNQLSFVNVNDPVTEATAPGVGNYQVIWTLSAPGSACSVADTMLLNILPNPSMGTPTYQCDASGSNFTVSVSISGGTSPYEIFDIIAGTSLGFVPANNTFISPSLPSGSAFEFELSDANSCFVTLADTYTCSCISQASSINTTIIEVCDNQTADVINLGGETLDANDILSYLVYPQGADIFSTILESTSPNIAFDPNLFFYDAVYEVVVAVGNNQFGTVDIADPCLSLSAPVAIIFHQAPQVTFGTYPSTLCAGQCESLDLSLTGIGPWQVTLNTGSIISVFAAPDTTVQLCAEPDGSSCFTSVSDAQCIVTISDCINYTVTPAGYAGAALPSAQVCLGASGTLNLSDYLSGEDAGGTWTDISTTAPPVGSFNAANGTLATSNLAQGSYQFEYTVSNSGTCPNSTAIATVVINPIPAANAGLDSVLNCAHPNVIIGTPAQAGLTYNWTLNNGFFSNQSQPSTFIAGVYTLTVSNANLCSSTDQVEVTINFSQPNALLSSDISTLTCLQTSAMLSAVGSSAQGNISYQWFLGSTPLVGNTSTLSVNQAGNYNMVVTSSTSGCTDTATISLNSNIVAPAVVVSAPDNLNCVVTQVAIQTTGTATGANINLLWTGPSIDDVSNPYQPLVSAPGVYTVTVTNSTTGCTNTATIIVAQDLDQPTITAIGGNITCTETTVTLDATVDANGAPTLFGWYSPNGILSGDLNSLNPIAESPGVYFIIATNLNNQCSDTASAIVSIDSNLPNGLIFDNQMAGCFGQCNGIITVDSVIGGAEPYSFSINNGPMSVQNTMGPFCADTFTVRVIDANGCLYDTLAIITQYDSISIDLGADTTIALGNSVELNAISNAGPIQIQSIEWPELQIFCTNDQGCLNQTVLPLINSTYSVELIDENGCIANDSREILVTKARDIFIPNVFSPNEDTQNDFFFLYPGIEVAKVLRMEVYDRWGNRLFSNLNPDLKDVTSGWNGYFRGEKQQAGVYTYFFEVEFIDGVRKIYAGDVTLLN